jgi:hypothetical protein
VSIRKLFLPENRPISSLLLVTVILAIYGYLSPESSASGNYVYLANPGGAVLFAHAAHKQYDTECVDCHHELVQGEAGACHECHDDPEYTGTLFSHDELVEVADHSCDSCHNLLPDTEARNCRRCHDKTFTGGQPVNDPLNCQQCHEDPDYTADDFSHLEFLEIEDHSCLGCHSPSPVGDIYHQGCTACHRERAAEIFVNDQDQVICKSCHLI